jgi:hypothetical protein
MDDVRPKPWGRWQRKLLRRGTVRGAIAGGACGLAGALFHFRLTADRPGLVLIVTLLMAVIGMAVGRVFGAVLVAICAALRHFFENVY